jgi:serpin B
MKELRKVIGLVCGALLVLSSSCNNDDDGGIVDEAGTRFTLSDAEIATMKNINTFSLNFYKAISGDKTEYKADNFIVSPMSAAMSMTMMANACEGKSQEEILKAFGYSAGEISDLNTLVGRLCKELPEAVSSHSTLNFVNSVWVNDGYNCNQDYIDNMSNLFGAKVGVTPVNSEKGAGEINDWISKSTNGVLNNVFSPSYGGIVVMVNSLYFEAPWNKAFDKGKTSKKEFHNIDGTTSKVDMMRGDQDVYYYEDSDLKAISIYYSKSAFSYTIVMPQKTEDFNSLLSKLDADQLEEIFRLRSKANATIVMPKVNIKSDIDARKAFQTMGITRAFQEENNDFSPLGNPHLEITSAVQSNVLNVSEEKTVVVSTTKVEAGMLMLSNEKELGEVIIDRPYIFIINGISGNYGLIAMGQVTKL